MKFTASFAILSIVTSALLGGNYYYDKGQIVELQPLPEQRVADDNPISYYLDIRNQKVVGVDQEIIIKLSKDSSLEKIIDIYGLKIKRDLGLGMWLLESLRDNPLEICQKLYESGLVQFAHPDFHTKRVSRAVAPTDPFFEYAWHFFDTDYIQGASINLLEAWDYTKGGGVNVAVFDDAVDTLHEDLSAAVVSSYNVQTKGSDTLPASADDSHGTFVAGLVVAQENGIGTVGVAPAAKLIGLKSAVGDVEDSHIIDAFNYAKENADVMNNSWGGYNLSEAVKVAIVDAANNGRNGKGMIITFGHGNDACRSGNLCYQNGDTTGEGLGYIKNDESAIEEVLAVGAMNQLNQRASYSNWGDYLDISAPGGDGDNIENGYGMVSLLLDNGYAYNDPNQVGTSYSAPVVAGVVALMLSANPDLTRQEVFDILRDTADQVGGYSYDPTTKKSAELGWGKVNASKAVAMAAALKEGGESSSAQTSSLSSSISSSAASSSSATDECPPGQACEEDDESVAQAISSKIANQSWSINGYFYKGANSATNRWDYIYCDIASNICLRLQGAKDDGNFDYDFNNLMKMSDMSGEPYGYFINYDQEDPRFGWALVIPEANFIVKLKGANSDRTGMEYNNKLNDYTSFEISENMKSITFYEK